MRRGLALRVLVVPLLVAVLGVGAATAVVVLQNRSDIARRSQVTIGRMRYAFQSLGAAPFEASPKAGGSPAFARSLIVSDEGEIARSLAALEQSSPAPMLAGVAGVMVVMKPLVSRIYWIGGYGGGYGGPRRAQVAMLQARLDSDTNQIDARLTRASSVYAARASSARTAAMVGSLATMALLIGVFAVFYRRSVRVGNVAARLAAENGRLLDASRVEAVTDALTGLSNRRALIEDLQAHLASVAGGQELMVALFDLNGFKEYNDTFGHLSGDALLTRLGDRLADALAGAGSAYRMGGDEFCVLAVTGPDGAGAIATRAAAALSEQGEAFSISCAYGIAQIPRDASSSVEALRLADRRMYEHKTSRASAARQSMNVLVTALAERSPHLGDHLSDVARLATATARQLGLPEAEIKRIAIAAELHDIGKVAIPESILNRPGPLDEQEWDFMRTHTLIGERIVRAAASLAHTADLVRASHERYDGHGYPDHLQGVKIPLGASIITVCDAFNAMTTPRPYRKIMTPQAALTELLRCSGSHFDPGVVCAFAELVVESTAPVQVAAA